MKQGIQQILIYGAFGLLLGAKMVEVLINDGVGLFDYWLLGIGLAAAIIHYLPKKHEATDHERSHSQAYGEDTLVLRDHSRLERGQHPEAADTDAFGYASRHRH
ncbi:hypothetical protein [Lewinella sp. W8]|uniref:hypothetical protein n=1 Tax=Lewinella sp. W8 TaxID=2528208 RepID=UPI0015660BF9|nr:hypothetical protein [Lewinella sp. W8]